MQLGSAYFSHYSRTLSRVLWAEFIHRQVQQRRRNVFHASLVDDPFEPRKIAVSHVCEFTLTPAVAAAAAAAELAADASMEIVREHVVPTAPLQPLVQERAARGVPRAIAKAA